jgi:hypothetical protein
MTARDSRFAAKPRFETSGTRAPVWRLLAANVQFGSTETSPCLNRSRRRSPDARDLGLLIDVVIRRDYRDADTPHEDGIPAETENCANLNLDMTTHNKQVHCANNMNIFASMRLFGRCDRNR